MYVQPRCGVVKGSRARDRLSTDYKWRCGREEPRVLLGLPSMAGSDTPLLQSYFSRNDGAAQAGAVRKRFSAQVSAEKKRTGKKNEQKGNNAEASSSRQAACARDVCLPMRPPADSAAQVAKKVSAKQLHNTPPLGNSIWRPNTDACWVYYLPASESYTAP